MYKNAQTIEEIHTDSCKFKLLRKYSINGYREENMRTD